MTRKELWRMVKALYEDAEKIVAKDPNVIVGDPTIELLNSHLAKAKEFLPQNEILKNMEELPKESFVQDVLVIAGQLQKVLWEEPHTR